jgi:hypothetical protein
MDRSALLMALALAIAACARTPPSVDTTQTTGAKQSAEPNEPSSTSADPEMSREPRDGSTWNELYTPAGRPRLSSDPWSSEMPGGAPPGGDIPPLYTNPEPVGTATRTAAPKAQTTSGSGSP